MKKCLGMKCSRFVFFSMKTSFAGWVERKGSFFTWRNRCIAWLRRLGCSWILGWDVKQSGWEIWRKVGQSMFLSKDGFNFDSVVIYFAPCKMSISSWHLHITWCFELVKGEGLLCHHGSYQLSQSWPQMKSGDVFFRFNLEGRLNVMDIWMISEDQNSISPRSCSCSEDPERKHNFPSKKLRQIHRNTSIPSWPFWSRDSWWLVRQQGWYNSSWKGRIQDWWRALRLVRSWVGSSVKMWGRIFFIVGKTDVSWLSYFLWTVLPLVDVDFRSQLFLKPCFVDEWAFYCYALCFVGNQGLVPPTLLPSVLHTTGWWMAGELI